MRVRSFMTGAAVLPLVVGGAVWGVGPAAGTPHVPGAASGHEYFDVSSASPTDAWLVGFSLSSDFVATTLARHWDGHRWRAVPTPNPSPGQSNWLYSVVDIAPDDAWAVGESKTGQLTSNSLLLHWDGSTWTQVPSESPGNGDNRFVEIDATGPDDVWALGSACDQGGGPRPGPAAVKPGGSHGDCASLNAHWDGSTWSTAPSSIDPALQISGTSSDDLWAVGYVDNKGGGKPFKTWLSHYDGTAWTRIKAPNPGDIGSLLGSVSADRPDDAWAVGVTPTEPNDVSAVLHWDGTAWHHVTDFPVGVRDFRQVDALAPDDVWGWGDVGSLSGIVHWDGSTWQLSTELPQGSDLSAVDLAAPDLGWAVGQRSFGGNNHRRILLAWDGKSWRKYRQ